MDTKPLIELESGWFSQPQFSDRRDGKELEESCLFVVNDPLRLDLHVSYSEGFENGPVIQRSGDGPPFMEDPRLIGSTTQDADGQRIGTNYIWDKNQVRRSEELFLLFAGNYIAYAALPNTLSPRTLVENILADLSQSFDTGALDRFLSTDYRGEVNELFLEVVTAIPDFKKFLLDNQKYFHPRELLFFDDYDAIKSKIQRKCRKVMDDLYQDDYPKSEYVEGYHTHKYEEGFQGKLKRAVEKYLPLFVLSRFAPSHEDLLRKKILGQPSEEIVLMQGCGDLTMNLWNVAFVSGDSLHGEDEWKLLHSSQEPLNDRLYTCLVKWRFDKEAEVGEVASRHRIVYPYQIVKLQFRSFSLEKR
ncbi:MAG: hypothetical protein ACREDR_09900, partial [Blastocatellia bacterium]